MQEPNVNGFIICYKNEGSLIKLKSDFTWSARGYYVHSHQNVKKVRSLIRWGKWQGEIPQTLQRARWSSGLGIQLVGKPVSFPYVWVAPKPLKIIQSRIFGPS